MGWTGCFPREDSLQGLSTASGEEPMIPTAPLASIGIDIGKEVFHIVGFGTDGKIAFRRKIKRLALAETFRSCHLVWWSEWRHASARTLSAGPCGSLVMSRRLFRQST